MYWVMRRSAGWKNQILHAEIQYNIRKERDEPHWWSGKRINEPSLNFKFLIKHLNVYPDSLWTANEIHLYSDRIITILEKSNINYEIFSTLIFNRETNKPIDLSHKVVRILEVHPALDEDRSEFEDKTIEGAAEYFTIRRAVLREEFLNSKIPLARVQDHLHLLLISDDLKNDFILNDITGFKYIPVEEYKDNDFQVFMDLFDSK